jgi:hypothetical protein
MLPDFLLGLRSWVLHGLGPIDDHTRDAILKGSKANSTNVKTVEFSFGEHFVSVATHRGGLREGA